MPEVDFIRFVAISAVVLYHIHGFVLVKQQKSSLFGYQLDYIFKNGDLGVQLFFVLSGFILALPFAKSYFSSNKSPILSKFYLRRFTRLEPPYILFLTLLLPFILFYKEWEFNDAVSSYLLSLGYIHNIFGGELSKFIIVTWSLEIEIFFYLFFPLLACVFKFSKYKRRILLLISMCCIPYLNYDILEIKVENILGYFQYFASGMLLADIYLTERKIKFNNITNSLLFLSFLILLFIYDIKEIRMLNYFLYPLAILGFYYVILSNADIFKLYTNKYLAIIGGMCYSMYLTHYIFISVFGNYLISFAHSTSEVLVFFTVISIIILIGTVVFFLLIEKPCMDPNWCKFKHFKSPKVEENKSLETVAV